jgi:hypothetical protein
LESEGGRVALAIARRGSGVGETRSLDEGAWRLRVRAIKGAESNPKMSSFLLLGAARQEGDEGAGSLAADADALRALIAEAETAKTR